MKKIIIRTPNFIGDTINTTPCIQLIKQEYPDASLIIVGPEFVKDIFKYDPRINKIITFPLAKRNNLSTYYYIWKQVRKEKGDLGVILINTFISALEFKLAGIKCNIGYAQEKREILLDFSLPLNRNIHYINRYAYLFNEFLGNKYKTLPELNLPISNNKVINFQNNRPTIGFYPGGSIKKFRQYPPDYASELLYRLEQKGYNIVLLGNTEEGKEYNDYIQKAKCKNVLNLAGKINIEDFFNAIDQLDLLITIDSAAMHAAAALKTPFIALLGQSTSPVSTIIPKVDFGKIIRIEKNQIREEDYIYNITPQIICEAIDEVKAKGLLNK